MTFLKTRRNAGHMKYRCRIIGRLISIEVLQESFHLNTPIKDELQTVFIIIHHHTRSSLSTSSILWIQVLRQSSPVESLSGSQSSSSLLSGQDSLTLSSLYLGLQGSPILPSSQLFQNSSRHIHTSGSIFSDNPQRPVPSSLALLVSDLCHLVSTP